MNTASRADEAHKEAVLEAARTRPCFVAPCRGWTAQAVRDAWTEALESRWDELVSHPGVDFLVEVTSGEVTSWAVVEHDVADAFSGEKHSVIHAPSWVSSAEILAQAAAQAARHGTKRLAMDVPEGDYVQAGVCAAAGMSPDIIRMVRALPPGEDLPPEKAQVRAAEARDELFLLSLDEQCAPFMVPRNSQGRYLDVYASLHAEGSDVRGWIAHAADGAAAGALIAKPHAQRAFDGAWESYVYDISVLPEFWGRSIASSLVSAALRGLRDDGAAYVSGDLGASNERLLALARRFDFCPESRRFFLEF